MSSEASGFVSLGDWEASLSHKIHLQTLGLKFCVLEALQKPWRAGVARLQVPEFACEELGTGEGGGQSLDGRGACGCEKRIVLGARGRDEQREPIRAPGDGASRRRGWGKEARRVGVNRGQQCVGDPDTEPFLRRLE